MGLENALPIRNSSFAAGYAACFDSALAFGGAQRRVKLSGSQVDAAVSIGTRDGGGFQPAVQLAVTLPDIARDEAQQLVNAAHSVCPYSNAVRNNIDVSITVL